MNEKEIKRRKTEIREITGKRQKEGKRDLLRKTTCKMERKTHHEIK